MVNLFKIIFIFQVLTFVSFAHAEVDAVDFSNLEKELELFEANCEDENGQIYPDKFLTEINMNCEQLHVTLIPRSEEYEQALTSPPELTAKRTCHEAGGLGAIMQITSDAGNVLEEEELECSEAEKRNQEVSCKEANDCNKYRSFSQVGDIFLPSVINRPVQSYIRDTVRDKNYDTNSCLNKDKSNCMQEIFTSFVGSIWSTTTAVWDVVKAGFGSLLSPIDWFTDKAETSEVAATQSVEDVKSFLDNPGEWLDNMYEKIQKVAHHWITHTVFCQKWEGTPHLSECKVPSTKLDCIGCNDKINAMCAGIGALTSEVGMMIFTAGVGNAASITARVGVRSAKVMSRSAQAKIAALVPKMKPVGFSGANQSRVAAAAKAAAAGVAQTARMTAETFSKYKAALTRFGDKLHDSRAMRAVAVVADAVVDPLHLATKFSRVGVNGSNRVLAAAKLGRVSERAEVSIRLGQKASTSRLARNLIDKRDNHTTRRIGTRGAQVVQRGRKAGPDLENPDKGLDLDNPNFNRQNGGNRNQGNGGRGDYDRNRVTNNDGSRNRNNNNPDDRDLNNNRNKDDENNNDLAAAGMTGGVGPRLLGAAALVDVGAKVSDGYREEQEEQRSRSRERDDSNSFQDQDPFNTNTAEAQAQLNADVARLNQGALKTEVTSSSELKSAIGVEGEASLNSAQAKQKIASLEQMYSTKNKRKLLKKLQQTGMTRDQAEEFFENRQQEVHSASDYYRERYEPSNGRGYAQTPSNSNNISQERLSELEQQQIEKLFGESDALQDMINSYQADTKKLQDDTRNLESQASAEVNNVAATGINQGDQLVEQPRQVTGRAGNSGDVTSNARRFLARSSNFTAAGSAQPQTEGFTIEEENSEEKITEGEIAEQDPKNPHAESNGETVAQEASEELEGELQEEVSEEIAEKTENTPTESRANSLSALLGAINKKNVEILSDHKVDLVVDSVKVEGARDEGLKRDLERALRLHDGKAKVYIRYKVGLEIIDVYEFPNGKKFYIHHDSENKLKFVDVEYSKPFISRALSMN